MKTEKEKERKLFFVDDEESKINDGKKSGMSEFSRAEPSRVDEMRKAGRRGKRRKRGEGGALVGPEKGDKGEWSSRGRGDGRK